MESLTASRTDEAGDYVYSGTSSLTKRGHNHRIEIRVAHSIDEMMMAFAIRSAVFLAEQSCPYLEEFDGNDTTATHVIGFVDGEPAATIRIRYFGKYTKMERMAIRREFRGTDITSHMLEYVINFAKRKGYREIVVHTQTGRERFWRVALRRYGGYRPITGIDEVAFSGHSYLPIHISLEADTDAFRLNTNPHVMNRPEGDWDRPGVLEMSVGKLPEQSRKIRT